MYYVLVGVIGLAIGSFLNVLIYRIPRRKKFVSGYSKCPKCGEPIRFYDNIPLLSYLILGGKCRHCEDKISFRYPLVEILNAAIYLFLFWQTSFWLDFLVYAFISSALIVIFFVDLDFQIIPDLITIPGIVLGLGVSLFITLGPQSIVLNSNLIGIGSSALGLIIGGGGLYLVAELGDRLFKKESMGGGDIKMAAMLGAFLGWKKVIIVFFGGAVLGLLGSIVFILLSKEVRSRRIIPFGPFLALAAFAAMLYGDRIILFYMNNFFIS